MGLVVHDLVNEIDGFHTDQEILSEREHGPSTEEFYQTEGTRTD
jgi:hypothetical protein